MAFLVPETIPLPQGAMIYSLDKNKVREESLSQREWFKDEDIRRAVLVYWAYHQYCLSRGWLAAEGHST